MLCGERVTFRIKHRMLQAQAAQQLDILGTSLAESLLWFSPLQRAELPPKVQN